MGNRWTLTFVALAALLLGSCSGGSMTGKAGLPAENTPPATLPLQTGPPPGGLPQLPALEDLDRLASNPLDYNYQTNYGALADAGLPTLNFEFGQYAPGLNESSQLPEPAYAIYSWQDIPDYTGDVVLGLIWLEPAPDPADVYIGVADYSTGRWLWQSYENGRASFGPAAQFRSPGQNIYTAVVVSGEMPANLQYVILGDVPPFLTVSDDLDEDPLANLAPRDVTLDASGSTPVLYPISHFDFDFDGDGTFEVENIPDGIAMHHYAIAGKFQAVVRVTDTEGLSDTVTHSILIIDPDNQPPSADFSADVLSGGAPLAVNFDPSLSSDPDGTLTRYQWDFDGDGQFEQSSSSPDPVSHTFTRLGMHDVTLQVTDNYLAQDQFVLQINCGTGWTNVLVRENVQVYDKLAVAAEGSGNSARAGLMYIELPGQTLTFQKALGVDGSAWDSPVDMLGAPLENLFEYGLELSGNQAGDAFIAGYSVFDGFSGLRAISCLHSDDATGNSWSSPVDVNSTDDILLVDMQLINGKPCLAGIQKPNSLNLSQPVYFESSTADGSAWNGRQQVFAPVSGFKSSLAALGYILEDALQKPVLLVNMEMGIGGGSGQQLFVRAQDAAGSSWDNAVQLGTVNAFSMALGNFDGRPGLCFSGDTPQNKLIYGISQDSGGTDWSTAPAQIDDLYGNSLDMQLQNGNPIISYSDTNSRRIKVVRALDAAGTNWGEPELVVLSPEDLLQPRLVIVNDQPLILYGEKDSQTLRCAYFAD